MTYLITQTFIFLLAAALLGGILGWYLTRISAAAGLRSVQGRLDSALANADKLRAERDVAITARDSAENARRVISDDMNDLRAELAAAQASAAERAPVDSDDVARLEGELDDCRNALAAMTAPAKANEQVADTAAIASAAAAAASGANSLMGGGGGALPTAGKGGADDLQQIKGIGPKIAGILHDLGIQQYAQIAAWTPENVAWVNDHLKFKGRVERERWIEQARALMESTAD